MKQLQRLLYLFGLIILITLPALAQRDVYDAPIIIQPFNNAKITALQPQFMVFIWTATGPAGFGTTRYRFEMVDMTENNLANPEDAFRSKAVRLYYVEDNLLSPNLLYNLSKPPLQQGHKYAVRVIASDDEFQPTFRNGGISRVNMPHVWFDQQFNVHAIFLHSLCQTCRIIQQDLTPTCQN